MADKGKCPFPSDSAHMEFVTNDSVLHTSRDREQAVRELFEQVRVARDLVRDPKHGEQLRVRLELVIERKLE